MTDSEKRRLTGQRSGRPDLSRRGVLRAGLAGGGGLALGLEGATAAAAGSAQPARRGEAGVSFRWLGVAGWEISFDGRVVYMDPYLSRFDYREQGGAIRQRPEVVEGLLADGRLAGPPELVLVSHGHWDHLTDVPYLLDRPAWRDTEIHTIGTETHRNLLAALGVSPQRLKGFIDATGGEHLTFAEGLYQVQVVKSLHSQSKGYGIFAPGTRTAPPARPETISDLVEGGTLAYQLTVADRLSVLMFGGTNFSERELVGLRPDVLMVSMTDHSSVHRYLERLLTVLDGPRYVIPCHHDDMVTGFDAPDLADSVDAQKVREVQQVVRSLRLRSEVVAPRHLEQITL